MPSYSVASFVVALISVLFSIKSSIAPAALDGTGLEMSTSKVPGFEPVNLETALAEPDGFYAELGSAHVASRKIVLIRLPSDLPISVLDERELVSLGRKRPLVTFPHQATSYELWKSEEKATVALVLPGIKKLTVDTAFDEVWTVKKAPEPTDNVQGVELDFDGDIGGRGAKKAQPEDLRMNLSAVNLESVIKRTREKKRGASKESGSDKTSSPKKKKSH